MRPRVQLSASDPSHRRSGCRKVKNSQGGGRPEGDRLSSPISCDVGGAVSSARIQIPRVLSLNLQGDANRSYSDDDRSSSNFDESEKHDSIKMSGEPQKHVFILFMLISARVRHRQR